MSKIKSRLFLTAFLSLLLVASAQAGTYFGLTPGDTTYKSVPEIVRKSGGRCNDQFGYKGYGDLPVIRVDAYGPFEKYGALDEAWLQFTPSGKLHQIYVSWFDEGQSFRTIKDALEVKYGHASPHGFGFNQEYEYRDGKVAIILGRNTFGFGRDQKTSLTYTHTPSAGEVEAMKKKIEAKIRNANAAKAAGDL
ncbi:hypothetical protein BerOc1_00512 [Pseudodesulfovibrio hydrargyri]|uniref:Uncharacterized protein n=1 Tax=Pseudodesulfovibrio hydrargyri TaxID=2125990 RepID=A0A1J5NB42_9BACT|nr:hypothetical protein [Pseudodesulfovibrio hydrargyri]OIQ52040.1 hypothetical protein BerOc1_00512 [Pseudodesulfovibrio hydrargyri]